MSQICTTSDLEAYLDEALPAADLARVEGRLRADPQLAGQLAEIIARRDAGVHTLGEIWRRHRISCPTRLELGAYLLGTLEPPLEQHIRFHVEVVGCRPCGANLDDLRARQAQADQASRTRRQRYFHSSAGYLPRSG